MKRWIFSALMLCMLPLNAQDHVQDESEKKGRVLLQQMVEALGGPAWLNRSTWETTGRAASFFKNEPEGVQLYREFHKSTPGSSGVSRIELTKKRDVVEIWTADAGYDVIFKGKKPLPKDVVESYFRRQSHSIDTVVQQWLKQPGTIVSYDGLDNVQRRQVDRVTIINPQNDAVTLDLDSSTHLPSRRSFRYRNATYGDYDQEQEEYADYHVYDGVQTPLSITRYKNGDMTAQIFVQTAKYNVSLPEEIFNPDRPYNAPKVK